MTESITERRAEAMAEASGYGPHDYRRPHFVIGVMGACAEEMEQALAKIASGKLRAGEQRTLARYTLQSLAHLSVEARGSAHG